MKTTLKIALVLTGFAALGSLIACNEGPEIARTAAGSEAGEGGKAVAPDVQLALLDGSTFRLADHVGRKVIVLNFFATWCGPCRMEMPELERYYARHRDEGVLLVGVDAQERQALVEQFVSALSTTFPITIDGTGDVLKNYDVTAFPTTVVIGVDGRVKLRVTGAIPDAESALDPIVKPELLALGEQRGISRDAYLAALAAQPPNPGTPRLDARGERIAAAMTCPCGCSDKVAACNCRSASGVKARLAQGGFEDRTDAEVMTELQREFAKTGM